jgi:hypothetical protein
MDGKGGGGVKAADSSRSRLRTLGGDTLGTEGRDASNRTIDSSPPTPMGT